MSNLNFSHVMKYEDTHNVDVKLVVAGHSVIESPTHPVLASLLSIGFLTGSRAFGGSTDDSDYDIAYCVVDTEAMLENIPQSILDTKEESEYFSGWKILENGITINCIPIHPHEYKGWYLATLAMKAMYPSIISSDLGNDAVTKVKVHAVFQGIIQHIKGIMPLLNMESYGNLNKEFSGIV